VVAQPLASGIVLSPIQLVSTENVNVSAVFPLPSVVLKMADYIIRFY
jgi:hypothetical protein